MNKLTHKFAGIVLALSLSVVSAQSALAAVWSNSAGAAPSGNFTWSNGQDINGLFGNPIVTPNDRFVFNAGGFGINDPTPGDAFSNTQSDTVSWDLHLTPGFQLTGMVVRAFGSYAVQGDGSYVDLLGTLEITEFEAQPGELGPRTRTGNFVAATPGAFPLVAPNYSQGSYSGLAEIDISFEMPIFDNNLHISFANLLEAFAVADGNASLNQTFQQFTIEIELIPEPATLALVGLGAVALIRRRR